MERNSMDPGSAQNVASCAIKLVITDAPVPPRAPLFYGLTLPARLFHKPETLFSGLVEMSVYDEKGDRVGVEAVLHGETSDGWESADVYVPFEKLLARTLSAAVVDCDFFDRWSQYYIDTFWSANSRPLSYSSGTHRLDDSSRVLERTAVAVEALALDGLFRKLSSLRYLAMCETAKKEGRTVGPFDNFRPKLSLVTTHLAVGSHALGRLSGMCPATPWIHYVRA